MERAFHIEIARVTPTDYARACALGIPALSTEGEASLAPTWGSGMPDRCRNGEQNPRYAAHDGLTGGTNWRQLLA